METKKVQVYQFDELTGKALENAKKLLKNLQDNYSEDYFWSMAREDMETDLVDCFGLDCSDLEFGLYPTHAEANNVELSEQAVRDVCGRIDKSKLPQGFNPDDIKIKKERYGCEIEEYVDFELNDEVYELIENAALDYINEALIKVAHNLELNDEYYYSDEFRDELIAMNDIVFDKFGNILNNNILEG
nr:MAG TPA: hypothetical protein [Caudoviricetes sp.]